MFSTRRRTRSGCCSTRLRQKPAPPLTMTVPHRCFKAPSPISSAPHARSALVRCACVAWHRTLLVAPSCAWWLAQKMPNFVFASYCTHSHRRTTMQPALNREAISRARTRLPSLLWRSSLAANVSARRPASSVAASRALRRRLGPPLPRRPPTRRQRDPGAFALPAPPGAAATPGEGWRESVAEGRAKSLPLTSPTETGPLPALAAALARQRRRAPWLARRP